MDKKPLVTIVMSVYNGEQFLREAIDSMLGQTFSDFDFLIINDASTDNSVKIINEYDDQRIKLIHNKQNIGLTKSLNKGLKLAQGRYIARMDADDISLPTRLEKQVDYMESHSEVGLCGGWFQIIEGPFIKKPETHEEIAVRMLRRNPFGHSTVMMRKSVLENHSLTYDETLVSSQDYDFWSRMINYTKAYNIPEVLVKYRVHNKQISASKRNEQLKNETKIKKAILKKLLPDTSDYEVQIHEKVVVGTEKISSTEFSRYCKFLKKLYEANYKMKAYEPDFLLRATQSLWLSAFNKNGSPFAVIPLIWNPLFTRNYSLLKRLKLVTKKVYESVNFRSSSLL